MSRRSGNTYVFAVSLVLGLCVLWFSFEYELHRFLASSQTKQPPDCLDCLDNLKSDHSRLRHTPTLRLLLLKPSIYFGAASLAPTLALSGPHRVIDSVTIRSGKAAVIKLAYVRGIGAQDICMSQKRRRFACGLMARASLQNLISTAQIICQPVFYGGEDIRFSCRLDDGTDLAKHQVKSGFAVPDSFGLSAFAKVAKEARKKEFGVWQGDWETQ